jgi:small-conductance mechanosensitive channel
MKISQSKILFTTFLIFLLFPVSYTYGQPVQTDTESQKELADTSKLTSALRPITDLVQSDTVQKKEEKANKFSPPELTEIISISNVIWTIITLIAGYFIIKLLLSLLNNIANRNKKYEFTTKRIIPIIRILSWIFLIYIIVVGIYSPPAATIFAFLASLGFAVGFAAQDLLKNVFGGLVVMFDRPFQIGDKIEAGKYYGEVVEIGIRSTKVISPDDSLITIPNSEFMMQYVSNANSGENNCQVVAEIYLPLNVDTERVRKIAMEAALVSKYIYLNKPIVVLFFNEFKDRSSVIKMRLKAYVSKLDKEFVFKSEMTELVIRELIKEGILQKDFSDQL